MNKIKFNLLLKLKKYGSMNGLTEEQQQILFDNMQDFSIEEKIYYFKEYNYKYPFINMSKEELDKLVLSNELSINAIISVISLSEDYDKLELLKEQNPDAFTRNNFKGLNNIEIALAYLYELNTYIIDNKTKFGNQGHDNFREILCNVNFEGILYKNLDEDGEDKTKIYDFVINNPKLREKLKNAICFEDPDINNNIGAIYDKLYILHLFRRNTQDSKETEDFYIKFIGLPGIKEKLFTEEYFLNHYIDTEYIYSNLPEDKKILLAFRPNLIDFNSENKNKELLKTLYKKYYPESSDEDINNLANIQNIINKQYNINKSIMIELLKKYGQDIEYINKLIKFSNLINGDKENEIIKKVCLFGINYPNIFSEIVKMDSIPEEMLEKINYLLDHNKFIDINVIDDVNNNSLEEIKTKKYASMDEQKKTTVYPSSPNSGKDEKRLGGTFVDEGYKGIIRIEPNTTPTISCGRYHPECGAKIYGKYGFRSTNPFDYIAFGTKIGDAIVLFEGEQINVFMPDNINQSQIEKIFSFLDNSKIKDKIYIQCAAIISNGVPMFDFKGGQEMTIDEFKEECSHLDIKSNEDEVGLHQ